MALPGDMDTITLTGRFVDFAGVAMAGTISFSPGTVVKSPGANLIVYPKTLQATLTVGGGTPGSFSIVLPRTNDPDIHPEFVYSVTEDFTGQNPRSYLLSLPMSLGGSTVDLADLEPVATAAEVAFISHVHSNPLSVGAIRVFFGSGFSEADLSDDDFWIH